ncbi:hypothetical protein E3P98_00292 [Wallemia ichthyophaga]|nr:hypothetical protein E3P98_00292 [Wallemia ichthyophaga]
MYKLFLATITLLATYASSAAITKPADNQVSQLETRGNFLGDGTWYTTETGRPGSCGEWLNDGMMVVALNAPQMGDTAECNRQVWVTNITNGETQVARVVDKCPECLWGSLDMSPALFSSICGGQLGLGRVPITWGFCDREQGC